MNSGLEIPRSDPRREQEDARHLAPPDARGLPAATGRADAARSTPPWTKAPAAGGPDTHVSRSADTALVLKPLQGRQPCSFPAPGSVGHSPSLLSCRPRSSRPQAPPPASSCRRVRGTPTTPHSGTRSTSGRSSAASSRRVPGTPTTPHSGTSSTSGRSSAASSRRVPGTPTTPHSGTSSTSGRSSAASSRRVPGTPTTPRSGTRSTSGSTDIAVLQDQRVG